MDPLLKLLLERSKTAEVTNTDQVADLGGEFLDWLEFLSPKKKTKEENNHLLDKAISKLLEQDIAPDTTNHSTPVDKTSNSLNSKEDKLETMILGMIPGSPFKQDLKRIPDEMVQSELSFFLEARFSEAKTRAAKLRRFVKNTTLENIKEVLYLTIRKQFRIQSSLIIKLLTQVKKKLEKELEGKISEEKLNIFCMFLVTILLGKIVSFNKMFSYIPITKEYLIVARRSYHINRLEYASIRFLISKSDVLTKLQKKLLLMTILVLLTSA